MCQTCRIAVELAINFGGRSNWHCPPSTLDLVLSTVKISEFECSTNKLNMTAYRSKVSQTEMPRRSGIRRIFKWER